jgi:hypothetical protein
MSVQCGELQDMFRLLLTVAGRRVSQQRSTASTDGDGSVLGELKSFASPALRRTGVSKQLLHSVIFLFSACTGLMLDIFIVGHWVNFDINLQHILILKICQTFRTENTLTVCNMLGIKPEDIGSVQKVCLVNEKNRMQLFWTFSNVISKMQKCLPNQLCVCQLQVLYASGVTCAFMLCSIP